MEENIFLQWNAQILKFVYVLIIFFSKPKSIFVKYIICISVLQYFLIENFEIILNYQQFLSKLKGIKIIYMNSIQK